MAAILLSPFVLLWDLGRYLMFGFFGLLERLDPLAFAWRLLKRLAPPVVRLWRAILPSLLRIQIFVAAVIQRLSALVAPLLRLVRPLVDRVWRMLAAIGRSVAAVIARSAAEIRRRSAPTVRRLRTAWNLVARPFRAVAAATRRQVGKIREGLARIRRFQSRSALHAFTPEARVEAQLLRRSSIHSGGSSSSPRLMATGAMA